MQDAVEYCTKHDPVKLHFSKDCVADGTVRPYVMEEDAERMTEEEKDAIQKKKELYYQENWHRALLNLVRYKNPCVASAE